MNSYQPKLQKDEFNKLFEKNDDEQASLEDWGSLGGYTKFKNKKLHEQCEAQFTRKSDIFCGISIWVNGYTEPSSDHLKELIIEHGGLYQHYFSKTHVTHVIATNLPKTKIKDLKHNDKVVHPQWIVDSVNAARLLSIDKYLLYSVAKRDGNALSFSTKKTPRTTGACRETSKEETQQDGGDVDKTMISNLCLAKDVTEVARIEVPRLTKHNYEAGTVSKAPLRAGDDNFISEFYAHSRLHHLSMWKSELKKFTTTIQKKRLESLWSNKKKTTNLKTIGKLIMHVDLDSFFVAVALKLNPELIGKPVAVCHSGRGNGVEKSWSEIASCSYEARHFGVHNGMMLNKAKLVCPQLVCVPYNFDEYKNVSEKLYEVLSSFTCDVEAVSCDEALLDITSLANDGGSAHGVAEKVRSAILSSTECTASCGIGNSILIARLATKHAKPNGVCHIPEEEIQTFIATQKIRDLPGVGWAQSKKLDAMNVSVCSELQRIPLATLQKEFGQKQGERLYNFCRGQDDRTINIDNERKSVSAEINYGMRFTNNVEVETFVHQLAAEVEKRLKEIDKAGSQITLKIMTRRKDAGEPTKYMGHGLCESLSKSVSLPQPTQSSRVVAQKCCNILRQLKTVAEDLRGMGIQVTKLMNVSKHRNTMDLKKFTKPMSLDEMQKTEKINTKKGSIAVKANVKYGKRLFSAVDDVSTGNGRMSHKKEIVLPRSKAVPSLPCFEENIVQHVAKRNIDFSNAATYQGHSSSWAPDILKILPEDIRSELQSHQNREAVNVTRKEAVTNVGTLCGGTKKHTLRKENPRKSKSIFDARKQKDIRTNAQQLRKNPATIPKSYPTGHTTVRKSPKSNEQCGMLSPSQVDVRVITELPAEIQMEIISTMRRSGHLSTHSKVDNKKKMSGSSEKEFVSNTTNQEATSNLALLSPSQLDKSVLHALPEDIRHDVMSDALEVRKRRNNAICTRTNTGCSSSSETPMPIRGSTENTTLEAVKLLSPSQVDSSYLHALPEELREEVIEQVRSEKRRRQKIADQNISKELMRNTKMVEVEVPYAKIEVKQILPEIRGASTYEDLKSLLRQWIQEYEEPLVEDMEEFTTYCQKLLLTYNMETVQKLLMFFRRLCSNRREWFQPYNNVLTSIQDLMRKRYFGRLQLKELRLM